MQRELNLITNNTDEFVKSNLNEIVSESVMPREETQNELEKQSMLSSIQIVESLQGR